ncbi:MAG: tRNA-dihydrouridine synthase, partial [Bacteroidetes bacterium]|nr:tRNA-dihydrouridine synthase [Bacteroidota bacterium]
IQALSIHGRTRSQMYKGDADWTLIGEIKNNPRINIPIFGNGDVSSPEKAKEMRERYGVDGVMIGRASIGYPWIFNEIKHFLKTGTHLAPPTISDRVNVCKQHLDFSVKWKSNHAGIVEMRRHYTNYFKGLPNFKEHRLKLVTTYSYEEIISILDEVQKQYSEIEAI